MWFTYAGTGAPTIHFGRRADLPSLSLPVSGAAEKVAVTPRHDLQVPGVEIVFEITSANQNRKFRDVVVQTAGNFSALGAAHFTIQLDGGHANYLWNSLHSTRVRTSDLRSASWWAAKVPELDGWTDVTFSDDSGLPVVDSETLDYELDRGAVQPWQEEIAQTTTLWAVVSYTSAEGDKFVDKKISVSVTMTNAQSGNYQFLQSRQGAESVPVGLASDIYDAVGHLYYEGTITFIGDVPPYMSTSIGRRLNLSDGLAAWASMDSAIQSIEHSVDSGSTTFRFGPPEHLGPQDLVQLALANRRRLEVKSQKLYLDSEDDAEDMNSIGGPAAGTDRGISSGLTAKQTFADPNGRLSNSTGSVVVDGPGGTITAKDGFAEVNFDGHSGKMSATTTDGTLEVDPSATPEVFTVISGITAWNLAYSNGEIGGSITVSTLTITKVSNAIQSIVTGSPVTIPVSNGVPLYKQSVFAGLYTYGTTIKAERLEVMSIDETPSVADTTEISGENCGA